MNRLVIIGNGFDLAHGLPTSYGHFIDDYWKNIKNSNHNELVEFNIGSYVEFNGHENLNDLIDLIVPINNSFKREGIGVYKLKDFLKPLADNRIQIIQYKNIFFKLINQSSIENWVDIENIYYENLKERAKGQINKQNYIWGIKELNKEFEQVKNLFEKYLVEKILYKYDFNDYYDQRDQFSKISDIFYPDHIVGEKNLDLFLEEFPSIDHNDLKTEYLQENHNSVKCRIQFLCFNYTPTVKMYFQHLKNSGIETKINLIHGEINNPSNLINFGFGDEMDDEYKSIENLNDNEYLRNFKSFKYLQNSNYNDLLRYIDSDKFQVIIMGHSCGLSDRTLLNTIFEHNNCRSIKVFYHQREDGTDNYTEIIQNISRHFNKKKLMREKIVNKTLCQPLPQIQLPLK